MAEQDALNQKAVVARVHDEISADDFDALKKSIATTNFEIEGAMAQLDSQRSSMEQMLNDAQLQAIDLVAAWEKGTIDQRQGLTKTFFPQGLWYSQRSELL